jgi:hypothetical protein
MNCQQFEARLNDLLDERAPLELDDALRDHVRGCPSCRELSCRELWSGYGNLVEVMRFRAPPAVPAGLAERIVAAAVAENDTHTAAVVGVPVRRSVPAAVSRGRALWRAAAMAAAAAVLIAVSWRFDPPADHATPGGDVVHVTGPQAEPRPFSELAQDAANCYAGLARETRSELSDVLALVPRVESTPAAVLWGSAEQAPAPEVASQVKEGLRPLAESTMAALTSLFGGPAPENHPSGNSDL